VKSTGKAGVSNVMVGFVQGTKVTTNDVNLSTQRAKSVAAYLRYLGLKGAYVIRGDGVAKQPGAAARRVNVVIEYKWT
jgi:flagellar motor protein MotB